MIPQVRKLDSFEAFTEHLRSLGIDLPVDEVVEPGGVLAQPTTVHDGSAGTLTVPNRFAILPMEGWDGTADGHPTDLVTRRWKRFADGGSGLVWAEATAVCHDGRANPRQLTISDSTVSELANLRSVFHDGQIVGLQLTHSGRYSRPEGAPAPRTAYRHPALDEPSGANDASVMTDDELDELVALFVQRAVLADEAGFDFVDVKACHGYLGHELLSGFDRAGRYGGSFENRTRFMRDIITGIRAAAPRLAVGVRFSVFDAVPFRPGEDGVGVPAATEPYHHAFGAHGSGPDLDANEPFALIDMLRDAGVGLICTTAGSPYYCPHIQRPALFPPSDGYLPPEDPLVGVARQIDATAQLARHAPDMTVIGSAYSYLQEWLPNVAQAVIRSGDASMVGLGRIALSYPHLPTDVLAGGELTRRLVCRTFSDCTTAPRAGLVSGCYPLDPFYKARPERVELATVKRRTRQPRPR
ncbi:oxidoreductase [Ilumatobacter nonamiensis]|uniref:oxidoreductase n=1 Tax=Ilumatobacter nonamiensis TaxID=467093 RepID=UPI0003473D1D|nr:NADH:flavin oxidoreductase [Ilumatobacter nonamiensis]